MFDRLILFAMKQKFLMIMGALVLLGAGYSPGNACRSMLSPT